MEIFGHCTNLCLTKTIGIKLCVACRHTKAIKGNKIYQCFYIDTLCFSRRCLLQLSLGLAIITGPEKAMKASSGTWRSQSCVGQEGQWQNNRLFGAVACEERSFTPINERPDFLSLIAFVVHSVGSLKRTFAVRSVSQWLLGHE